MGWAAARRAGAHGLRILPTPFELRSFAIHAAWHPRVQHDPVHGWLRDLVRRAAGARVASVARPRREVSP